MSKPSLVRILVGALGVLSPACDADSSAAPGRDAAPLAVCGDGRTTPPEHCDGSDMGGQTCETYTMGVMTGELSCSATCEVDDTSCVPRQRSSGAADAATCCIDPTCGGTFDISATDFDAVLSSIVAGCGRPTVAPVLAPSLRLGCGLVGVTTGSPYQPATTWYEVLSGRAVGFETGDDAGNYTCEGRLPPGDCSLEDCAICNGDSGTSCIPVGYDGGSLSE